MTIKLARKTVASAANDYLEFSEVTSGLLLETQHKELPTSAVGLTVSNWGVVFGGTFLPQLRYFALAILWPPIGQIPHFLAFRWP